MVYARLLLAIAGLMGLVLVAGFAGNDANAQQIYRIVGSDGSVTFSDKAPLDPTPQTAATARAVALPTAAASAVQTSALPFELRQAATRYPVTLYTAKGCAACANGRAMLSTRGIPFVEKTVASNEDIEALKRLSGAQTLPFLTVGGQQLKGFSEVEWAQFLDAADYPKTSQLPATYTPAPATPLVAAEEPKRPALPPQQAPRAAAPAPAQVPAATAAENPAGIRF